MGRHNNTDRDGHRDWRHIKAAHADVRQARATAILQQSGIPFEVHNGGYRFRFTEPGRPVIDYYPPTGRWQVIDTRDWHTGGAHAFLEWYRQQQGAQP
jgi:hypothetical protein